MKIKRFVRVFDSNHDLVTEIDFQETPNDYRVRRVNNLMKKYPQEQGFIWAPFQD